MIPSWSFAHILILLWVIIEQFSHLCTCLIFPDQLYDSLKRFPDIDDIRAIEIIYCTNSDISTSAIPAKIESKYFTIIKGCFEKRGIDKQPTDWDMYVSFKIFMKDQNVFYFGFGSSGQFYIDAKPYRSKTMKELNEFLVSVLK